jgi:hypothetical protein
MMLDNSASLEDKQMQFRCGILYSFTPNRPNVGADGKYPARVSRDAAGSRHAAVSQGIRGRISL